MIRPSTVRTVLLAEEQAGEVRERERKRKFAEIIGTKKRSNR